MRLFPAFSCALALLVPLCWSPSVFAKTYTDTKKRFSVELPRGWKLAPRPGDRTGMSFRRETDGAIALFRVSVKKATKRVTAQASLTQYLTPFTSEIGYRAGGQRPSSVGLLPARQVNFTVTASGDKRTIREVEIYALHAFGQVHLLQFETLRRDKRRFTHDRDHLLASYKAKAGRRVYAPLVGGWASSTGSPALNLSEDMRFTLGPLSGTYRADGGRLFLDLAEGTESYRYHLAHNQLTLKNVNLDTPAVYHRTGAPRFLADSKKHKRGPLKRAMLVGDWRVVDVAGTEPLHLQLAASGSVSFGPLSGRWHFKRGLLTIKSSTGDEVTYSVSVDGKRMLLSGGELGKELVLKRD